MNEYFILKQDDKISNYPKIKKKNIPDTIWQESGACYIPKEQSESIIGYVELPFIEKPALMICEELKGLFSAYQAGGDFRPFFTDTLDDDGVLYYFFKPYMLDCLAEESKFNPDRTIQKLVLDQNKIGVNKIFQVKGLLEKNVIVDLEVLEQILCMGMYPLVYKAVEVV